jgi:hypothetical protein
MKKNLHLTVFALILVLFSGNEIKSQTRLLHYWHFNNTLPTTGAGGTHFGTSAMNSDYTKPNITTGYLRFVKVPQCVKDTGYWDNLAGDSINQRVGYGSCCPVFGATVNNSAVRTRNPTDSMMFLWYIPTKNFKNIKLTWESEASSTTSGQHRMNYSYSLDSGATFITSSLPQLFDSAGTAWGKITLNLSNISTVNNTNKLMLRILFSAPNTGSSGNIRYDNITVEGDSLCPVFTSTHYSTTICSGGTTTLVASGASTYTWNTSSNSASIVVNPTTTTNYTVTGTTSVGCTAFSVTTVLVTNSPVVTINSPTICSGTYAVLLANGLTTYTWNNGSNTQTISVSPSVTTTYSVSGVTAGCLITSVGNTTVTVNASPILSIVGGNSVCVGSSLSQTVSGATNYTWSSGQNTATISLTPSVTANYTVNGSVANGCMASLVKTITVGSLPSLNITGNAMICSGESATLTATGASATYTWGSGSNSMSITVTPTATASYSVAATGTNGCNNSSAYTVSVSACTGVVEHSIMSAVTLYPNPARSELNVKIETNEAESILYVYNMIGELIYSDKTKAKHIIVNTSDYSRGLYTLVIKSGTHQMFSKFVKE